MMTTDTLQASNCAIRANALRKAKGHIDVSIGGTLIRAVTPA